MRPVASYDGPLPALDGPAAPWPGELDGPVFVRRGPRGGEPALMVHGLGGAATNWTDLVALLAGRLECDAIDLPGFGHSPAPQSGSYRLSSHARAVVDLLERGGRGPVHLFGNSLGGAVATRVAAWRPDLVRSLTLVSPALPDLRPVGRRDPRLGLLALPGVRQVAGRALARATPEQRARAVLQLCYGEPSRVHPQRLQEAAEEVRRRAALPWVESSFSGSLQGLIASYLIAGERSLWRQAATVACPVLLVWGDRDRLVDPRLGRRAVRTFPDARLLQLPGVGHVAQMEVPEAVARAVLGLVEEVRTAAA